MTLHWVHVAPKPLWHLYRRWGTSEEPQASVVSSFVCVLTFLLLLCLPLYPFLCITFISSIRHSTFLPLPSRRMYNTAREGVWKKLDVSPLDRATTSGVSGSLASPSMPDAAQCLLCQHVAKNLQVWSLTTQLSDLLLPLIIYFTIPL